MARERASGVWERRKGVGESPPITDAFAAPSHARERKKNEEERVRGGTGTTAYLRRRRPICPWLPTTTRACGCSGGIQVQHCKLTTRTERVVGLRPPEKGTDVCC